MILYAVNYTVTLSLVTTCSTLKKLNGFDLIPKVS